MGGWRNGEKMSKFGDSLNVCPLLPERDDVQQHKLESALSIYVCVCKKKKKKFKEQKNARGPIEKKGQGKGFSSSQNEKRVSLYRAAPIQWI